MNQTTDYKRVVEEMAKTRRAQADETARAELEQRRAARDAEDKALRPLTDVLRAMADDPELLVRNIDSATQTGYPYIGRSGDSARTSHVEIRTDANNTVILCKSFSGNELASRPLSKIDELIPVLLGLIADMKAGIALPR